LKTLMTITTGLHCRAACDRLAKATLMKQTLQRANKVIAALTQVIVSTSVTG
jgi:hypothetical protein